MPTGPVSGLRVPQEGLEYSRAMRVRRDLAGSGLAGLLAVAGQAVRLSPDGVTLALAAGVAYAVCAVAAKDLLAGHGRVQVMAVLSGGGALLLVPVAALHPLGWLPRCVEGWLPCTCAVVPYGEALVSDPNRGCRSCPLRARGFRCRTDPARTRPELEPLLR